MWSHCLVQKTSLRSVEFCDCNIPLEVATGRWLQLGHKGMDMVRNNMYILACRWQVAQKAQTWYPARRTGPCFHVVYISSGLNQLNVTVEIVTRRTRLCFCQSSLSQLSNYGVLLQIVSSVSCFSLIWVASRDTVAHLHQQCSTLRWRCSAFFGSSERLFLPSFIFLNQTTMDAMLQPFAPIWILSFELEPVVFTMST